MAELDYDRPTTIIEFLNKQKKYYELRCQKAESLIISEISKYFAAFQEIQWRYIELSCLSEYLYAIRTLVFIKKQRTNWPKDNRNFFAALLRQEPFYSCYKEKIFEFFSRANKGEIPSVLQEFNQSFAVLKKEVETTEQLYANILNNITLGVWLWLEMREYVFPVCKKKGKGE